MYEPHLSSAFLVFRKPVIVSSQFIDFWQNLKLWKRKRDLVKHCEVGISVNLSKANFELKSLYTKNANGNVLHTHWKELIEDKNFPFVKVSLLRDNPTRQSIKDWERIIGSKNPDLEETIKKEIPRSQHIANQY